MTDEEINELGDNIKEDIEKLAEKYLLTTLVAGWSAGTSSSGAYGFCYNGSLLEAKSLGIVISTDIGNQND